MKRVLRILLVNNFWNKLTALILAVVIWTIVSYEVEGEYERNDITVEIMPFENGVVMKNVVVEPSHIVVKATFTAPKRIGQPHLAPAAKVRAVHRIENPTIGKRIQIEFNRRDFYLPYDVTLESVEPRRPWVILRLIVTRKLPVKVMIQGKPAKGYELVGKPLPEPTEVSVRGPKDVLEDVYSIQTEPVDIEGRSSSFSSDYSLVQTLKGKQVVPSTKVRVRINIRPVKAVRNVPIPVHVNMPLGYRYKALLPKAQKGGKFNLPVSGPEFLLDDPMLPERISAFVIVSPQMKPRPGIYYSAKVHLLVPPELAELELAGEHHVDLEVREYEKPKPKEKP